MEAPLDFRYVDLKDVDPNFTLLDPEVYNLRIVKAAVEEYVSQKDTKSLKMGETGTRFKMTFSVTDHPKFTGRRIWHTFWPNDFDLKNLRRISDATGVPQTGSLADWGAELTQVQPTVKLLVSKVPDVNFSGVPNPQNTKEDGTPGERNEITFKAGVQSGD